MKKYLLALTVIVAGNVSAQKLEPKDVPSPVVTKFSVFYPTVKNADWEKDNNMYKARFKDVDDRKVGVFFNGDGSLVKKEWKIPKSQLPDEVIETIKNKFKEHKIIEVELVEKGGSLFYEVETTRKETGTKVIYINLFTDYGGVVSSEIKK